MSKMTQVTPVLSCAETQERLTALDDGELAPDERDAARAHLAECLRCRAEQESLTAVCAVAAEWTLPTARDPWPALWLQMEMSDLRDDLQRLRAETQALRAEVALLRQERATPVAPSPRALFPYNSSVKASSRRIV